MKKYYTWTDIEKLCNVIVGSMGEWRPDYIVGITRGGNIPATMISHIMDVRCEALKVSFRDDNSMLESNAWMAEDAERGKNILIVDDINDTGRTFNWIKEDWSLFGHGDNVRFAVLTENLSSEFTAVSYCGETVDKSVDNVWLVYPWEKE